VHAFMGDRRSRGYLVISGGMGRGKSAFLASLVQEEPTRRKDPDEPVICHVIDSQYPTTCDPDRIARCLYDQLRRKYRIGDDELRGRAGVDDAVAWAKRDGTSKLAALLKTLADEANGEFARREIPEVLFIDAADQAEVADGTPLVPKTLPPLPPGV